MISLLLAICCTVEGLSDSGSLSHQPPMTMEMLFAADSPWLHVRPEHRTGDAPPLSEEEEDLLPSRQADRSPHDSWRYRVRPRRPAHNSLFPSLVTEKLQPVPRPQVGHFRFGGVLFTR